MEILVCHHPSEYPEICNLKRNARYAKILLDDYASASSELTALNQYYYHATVAQGFDKNIAENLRLIAMVETKHLELLANCILCLGVLPKYRTFRNSRQLWWNGTNVFYGNTLRQMLKTDIKCELQAIEQYKQTLRHIHDPDVQILISRIILDEEIHVIVLTQMLESL